MEQTTLSNSLQDEIKRQEEIILKLTSLSVEMLNFFLTLCDNENISELNANCTFLSYKELIELSSSGIQDLLSDTEKMINYYKERLFFPMEHVKKLECIDLLNKYGKFKFDIEMENNRRKLLNK